MRVHDEKNEFFETNGLKSSKIMIIIAQVNVPAGIWSQTATVEFSLRDGTAIEYVRAAKRAGYDVVMLPSIPGMAKASWRRIMKKDIRERIVVVAHGGRMVQHFIDHVPNFTQQVHKIALINADVAKYGKAFESISQVRVQADSGRLQVSFLLSTFFLFVTDDCELGGF